MTASSMPNALFLSVVGQEYGCWRGIRGGRDLHVRPQGQRLRSEISLATMISTGPSRPD